MNLVHAKPPGGLLPRRQGCLGMWRGGAVCMCGRRRVGRRLIPDHSEGSDTRASDKQPARETKIGADRSQPAPPTGACSEWEGRTSPSSSPPTTSTDCQTSYP